MSFLFDRSVSLCAAALATTCLSLPAFALDVQSTVTALRLANTITGGSLPTSDPLFAQMVSQVAMGKIQDAAMTAATSNYFAGYLARRMALEMQSPSLSEQNGSDNDSTAFIIAHFVGTPTTKPSISTLLSDNATYMVSVTANGTATPTHAAGLTAAQIASTNWMTQLTQVSGQMDATGTAIPAMHVGGYTTLSDRLNDNSFAQYATTAGTNLRMIEGIWIISTGLQLADVESNAAQPQDAPRFVPEYNPNFFTGQGQPACISCHGGGMSSLNHGYSAVADKFNYDLKNGFTYIATPTTATMKSLGSDPTQRSINATCNLTAKPEPVCNPDSVGADPNQSWNVQATWAATGVLARMGWRGPTTGQGLNALGAAIGQASIVYQNLTERVISEICPMGMFTAADVSAIASAADPKATPAGTDDIRTIVAMVAANPTCQ